MSNKDDPDPVRCDFCRRSDDDVELLIVVRNCQMCSWCIETLRDMVGSWRINKHKADKKIITMTILSATDD